MGLASVEDYVSKAIECKILTSVQPGEKHSKKYYLLDIGEAENPKKIDHDTLATRAYRKIELLLPGLQALSKIKYNAQLKHLREPLLNKSGFIDQHHWAFVAEHYGVMITRFLTS